MIQSVWMHATVYIGVISWVKIFVVQQYLVSSWLRLLLALQVKVLKVASFVGKIFMFQLVFNHENHEYFAPRKLPATSIQ